MAISGIGGTALSSINQTNVTGMRQKTAANMLEAMDTDKSGSVSKQEFVAFGEKLKAQGPNGPRPGGASAPKMPSADEFFNSADKNADDSLSVDELSSMMAKAETQMASAGSKPSGMGDAGKAGPHGGGGPPPGGGMGMGGSSGAKSSADTSASSTSATSDPADTNKDGKVSASEQLIYDLSHPTASKLDA
jgi:hypothetical protein